MTGDTGADWAKEYQAVSQVADMARDPDDFRVTRQSKVTLSGVLVPVGDRDKRRLAFLFVQYQEAFNWYRTARGHGQRGCGGCSSPECEAITSTMEAMLKRGAVGTTETPDFNYISLDPRDYTLFMAPDVPLVVVNIHTRPERCWFLAVGLPFEALAMNLGRMRVEKPTDQGYPVTIRTKWRALTNRVKQQEVRSAYQRLIQNNPG